MVGVAGRSKACYDCKRRRVKCDYAVPRCLRCSKAGIHCRGYQQGTLWVNRTPKQPSVTALSVMRNAQLQQHSRDGSRSSLGQLHRLNQLRTNVCRYGGLEMSQQDAVHFRQQALPILQDIYVPRDNFDVSFEDYKETETAPAPSSWIKAICDMQTPSAALDLAILAFCAIQVRLSGEPGISHDETVQLYNEALGKTIHDLGSQQARQKDETIGAIIMLSTCEVFIFSADTSWSVHAYGISELLRHRNPVADSSTTSWKTLFRRLCIVCVVHAMSQRRPLDLELDHWRQLLGRPERPGSFSELQDMTMIIPSMMHQVYSLRSNEDRHLVNKESHLDRLRSKYHELVRWNNIYQRYEADRTKTPFYWVVPSRASNPTDAGRQDKLFPFALVFSSVQSAVPWILCVTFMLGVLDCIQVLQSMTSTNANWGEEGEPLTHDDTGLDVGPEGPYQDPFSLANADRLARMMCQSMEFCYRSENGTFGPQATCSTQCVLLRYFARRGLRRELEWCSAIKKMTCEGSYFGMDLMRMGLLTDDV